MGLSLSEWRLCVYTMTSADLLLSTFKLRRRCTDLWSTVLTTHSPSDGVPSVDCVSLLASAPNLSDAVKLTVPFVMDEIEHPNIPTSIASRKAWTDAQRKVLQSNKPLTIRWKTEFDKQVSSLFFLCCL